MSRSHEAQRVATFGFPLLDGITGGMEIGDLVAVVGASGTGKSSLSRFLVSTWQRQGMTQWLLDTQLHQSTTRLLLAALAAGVAPRDVRLDKLSDHQQEAVSAWVDTAGKADVTVRNDAARALRDLIDGDERPRPPGASSGLPHIVVVDELSGLANPHDWRATGDALQAIKGFAVRSGVPVLVVVAAAREPDARAAWLETLGPYADKVIITDGLIPARHAKTQLTLIKNRKVGAITSSIEIGMTWSADLQIYRQT
jgi:energy-coupling factor transporter ATP-binding protein EcfA2